MVLLGGLAALPAKAQDRDPMLFYEQGGLTVRGHLQFGLNAVAERNLFWDLAATTNPGSGFDPDTNWVEAYIKPGVSFSYQLDAGPEFYGKLSAVSSYTWGTDAFDTGDTGDTTLEEAYLGIRGHLASSLSYDLPLGPRELTLGTGMLIANGAQLMGGRSAGDLFGKDGVLAELTKAFAERALSTELDAHLTEERADCKGWRP